MDSKPASQRAPSASFAYRVLLGSGLVVAVLLLLTVLWYAADALLISFAAILLAIVLRALADGVTRLTGLSERWALAVTITGLLAAFIALSMFTAPQITEQARQLGERLPGAIDNLYQSLRQQPLGQWLLGALPSAQELQDNGLGNIVRRASGLAYTAVQVFFGVFILIFLTLYLSINPRLYTNGLLHLVPFPYRPRAAEVVAATGAMLRWWLLGTLIRMALVGGLTFAGLWLLDLPLAMILALLAAVLDFVPYFGPIVAAIPAVLLAFTLSVQDGLYVVLLYAVVQQLESLIISPLVYHRTVFLPPVLTILAQIILYGMLGMLGILLATPLMAVALVWVKMLYVEQTLGDFAIDRPEQQIEADGTPPYPGSPDNPNDGGEK